MMERIGIIIKEIIEFITTDIWRIPLRELPKTKSFFIKQLRIILLALRGFSENKVQLRASALTFYSLLSIVPVVAMIFGIAKGFGFQDKLREELIANFEGHQEVLEYILGFSQRLLENAKGGFIAGAGVVLLLWSVMKVLGNIESSFNSIWQIKKPRVFVRKFSDYLTMMLIAPIFIILSSSVTVFITTHFDRFAQDYAFLEHFRFLLSLIPYILIWLLLTIVYMVMPNTKVTFRSAFIGGLIAGTIFQVTQWIYIHFQIGMNKYGAIYGGFAAVPLFIIWLQLSWLIVLLGAEISFANQNVDRYEFESDAKHISNRFKRLVSLMITNLIVKNFAVGKKPLTATEISQELKLPIRIVREITYELVEVNIFSESIADNPKERSYQPAVDINIISIDMVLKRLEERGSHHITVSKNKEYMRLSGILESFDESVKKSPSNILLKDI
ncbi:MAG: YihY/virulence factor BrkB family protein [Bacteroidales bacterium]|nr:MAG: YihY/virulence factor BrkB family protein [Bacteroidales bacterium]